MISEEAGARRRRACGWFFGGTIVLGICWLLLAPMAGHAFWVHMTMHMGVVAVAAPMLAFGVAGGRFDPVVAMPWLGAPIVASIVELIVVWGWHAPGPHHFARNTVLGLVLEQGMFLVSGFWIWISAFGGPREGRRDRMGSGVIGLLLTSMHMTLLGALLALAPRAVYHHHMSAVGMSALNDQHLGGAIMLVVGGVSYLSGGLLLIAKLLRERSREVGV